MELSINQAYVNALLVDATYVDLIDGQAGSELVDALKERLTQVQAQFIADNFVVSSAYHNSESLSSSFEGVVWEGKEGSILFEWIHLVTSKKGHGLTARDMHGCNVLWPHCYRALTMDASCIRCIGEVKIS